VSVAAGLWHELLEAEEVAHLRTEPPHDARSAPFPDELDERVRDRLVAGGLDDLYTHQREAWDAGVRGEHVIVTTGTASGKSLAFNLPVLDALVREPKLRALYLYPTKALAQDQARGLNVIDAPRVRAAIYDGDTPGERRWQIRKWANVVLTNPDMLHVGVLPHHDRWGDVLANLAYVVVDEAHVYRGVFGSHVGNVLRRLRRLARIYGAEPRFLLASATIANPGGLAHSLLGLDVTVVGDDAAPRAERTIALWNPELIDEELGLRASALGEASRLMAELVSRELRTLCFAKSRKSAELIHKFTVDRLGREYQDRLSPYRAGYTPAQRREIERRLAAGELLGVSATDALELGIDIGLLDCVISTGFPGTVASLRQQWGRAGRRGHGLAILVASEDALDQYFMREPETLLGRRVEAAILDHTNPRVLDGHVRAAAFEAPLDDGDRDVLGDEALERAALLPELRATPAGFVWAGRDYPAARVPLRSTSPDAFSIIDVETGSVLGLVEQERAYSTVHEGAVYLHLGRSYRVAVLDLDAVRRRPVHAGEEGHDDRDRGAAARRAAARPGADVGPCLRHRAGGRLPVEEGLDAGDPRPRRPRPSRDDFRDGGDLVLPGGVDAREHRPDADAAGQPACRRARADRAAAALGDVRPLGHRRPLDERPLPDRPADDLRLRRPSRRGGNHRARLRGFRGLGLRHGEAPRRLPVRARLPVLRAVAEVRKPERHARQGGCLDAARADAVARLGGDHQHAARRLPQELPLSPAKVVTTCIDDHDLRVLLGRELEDRGCCLACANDAGHVVDAIRFGHRAGPGEKLTGTGFLLGHLGI
jgi:DEAD/DEAH box helicase domain-containing protein